MTTIKENLKTKVAKKPNPMEIYLSELIRQIKTSDKVTTNCVLNSDKWTKSGFSLLANLIGADLLERMTDTQLLQTGSSVSAKTLQKIMEGTYKISLPIDPRVINTLNKIVFFLEYDNWDDFIKRNNGQPNEQPSKIAKENSAENNIKAIVETAIQTEFMAYRNLPQIPKNYLMKSYVKNSQAFNKIMEVLLTQQSNNCIISNQYNPSTIEILNLKVEKLSENYAQVSTTEFWELCWWDTVNNQYIKRYKNISEHVYIVIKENDEWKIKTNASSADFLKPSNNLPAKSGWQPTENNRIDNMDSLPISTQYQAC